MPAIDVKLLDKDKSSKGHQILMTNFTTIGLDVIENKANICSYIDNLIRLKIIEIPPTYHLTDETLYEPLEKSSLLDNLIPDIYKESYTIGYRHKIIVITNFGLLFKQICCL